MTTISRQRNARVRGPRFSRAQLALKVAALEPQTRVQLDPGQTELVRRWFRETREGLQAAIDAIDVATPFAKLKDQAALQTLRDDLTARLVDIRQREGAFFESNNVALRPPGDDVINETIRLTTAMANRIAAEKKAEAVVALLNDLAGLVTKVVG